MANSVTAQEIMERAKAIHEKIRGWRREIHKYPELTFTEQRTAGLVNSVLIDLGIKTETEVAKTGVVGRISGASGPTVGLRADMDALPINEVNGTGYDSTRPGIMHACGHDAHTAMLLGAATLLKGLADEGRLPGTIRLLFQPSEEAQDEEGKSGGMRMVEEGALKGLDAVFGIHVDAFNDVGFVSTRPGPMMAAADKFEIVVRGSGGHAARPQSTVDPIALSAHVINAVHQVVSRRLDPIQPGVITIGTIHGGTVNNVIPDSVTMTGTIRSFTPETRELLRSELKRAAAVVEPLGGKADVTIFPGYPPTVNNPEATALMMAGMRDLLGEEKVSECELIMGAEDFSYMAQAAPGCFLRLGVHNPGWSEFYPVHRADFRMDEDALPIGTAALVTAALRWMTEKR
ncbi:MAG: amidohydrolase [Caldilineaceae bacterium]|nr:amidohydrolase [Caldilineaceae bacterium]